MEMLYQPDPSEPYLLQAKGLGVGPGKKGKKYVEAVGSEDTSYWVTGRSHAAGVRSGNQVLFASHDPRLYCNRLVTGTNQITKLFHSHGGTSVIDFWIKSLRLRLKWILF